MIIANSALRASLAIYHLISNARSWNNYNIASRATQSNSVYVSVLQISTVLADGVSKSLCQKFLFSRERPLLAWGEHRQTTLCVRGLRESMRVMNKVLKIAHLNRTVSRSEYSN